MADEQSPVETQPIQQPEPTAIDAAGVNNAVRENAAGHGDKAAEDAVAEEHNEVSDATPEQNIHPEDNELTQAPAEDNTVISDATQPAEDAADSEDKGAAEGEAIDATLSAASAMAAQPGSAAPTSAPQIDGAPADQLQAATDATPPDAPGNADSAQYATAAILATHAATDEADEDTAAAEDDPNRVNDAADPPVDTPAATDNSALDTSMVSSEGANNDTAVDNDSSGAAAGGDGAGAPEDTGAPDATAPPMDTVTDAAPEATDVTPGDSTTLEAEQMASDVADDSVAGGGGGGGNVEGDAAEGVEAVDVEGVAEEGSPTIAAVRERLALAAEADGGNDFDGPKHSAPSACSIILHQFWHPCRKTACALFSAATARCICHLLPSGKRRPCSACFH